MYRALKRKFDWNSLLFYLYIDNEISWLFIIKRKPNPILLISNELDDNMLILSIAIDERSTMCRE